MGGREAKRGEEREGGRSDTCAKAYVGTYDTLSAPYITLSFLLFPHSQGSSSSASPSPSVSPTKKKGRTIRTHVPCNTLQRVPFESSLFVGEIVLNLAGLQPPPRKHAAAAAGKEACLFLYPSLPPSFPPPLLRSFAPPSHSLLFPFPHPLSVHISLFAFNSIYKSPHAPLLLLPSRPSSLPPSLLLTRQRRPRRLLHRLPQSHP